MTKWEDAEQKNEQIDGLIESLLFLDQDAP
jgi:hypothetical protein